MNFVRQICRVSSLQTNQKMVQNNFVKSCSRLSHSGPLIYDFGHDENITRPDEWYKNHMEFFSDPNIDGWLLRKGMLALQFADVVIEPVMMNEVFKACRRVNDLALAIRFQEAMQYKYLTYGTKDKVWPWIEQEIQPTLTELGIPTLKELGYDKPELAYRINEAAI